jgi:hypothetical protein
LEQGASAGSQAASQGAYLLRTNLDPDALWRQSVQLKVVAESITPARALESLRSILMVEMWLNLRDGGQLCLPRITEPEKEQALLLHHSAWQLPARPPPRTFDLPPPAVPWKPALSMNRSQLST